MLSSISINDLSNAVFVTFDIVDEEDDEDGKLESPYDDKVDTVETGDVRAIFKSSNQRKKMKYLVQSIL